MNEKGVVYIATDTKHVIEACKSAVSLRNSTPNITITLFTGEMSEYSCFDEIVIIKEPQNTYIDKVLWMYSSPYIQTLFLDTDTYVYDDISELFDLLTRFDIAVAHASNRISHASSCYMIEGVPVSFCEMNTGVILFKKSPEVKKTFSNWLNFYRRDIKCYFENLTSKDISAKKKIKLPHDQPSFREALYRADLRIVTLSPEYNCRFTFPFFASGIVKILHGHHENISTIAEIINRKTERRVFVLEQGLITDCDKKSHD